MIPEKLNVGNVTTVLYFWTKFRFLVLILYCVYSYLYINLKYFTVDVDYLDSLNDFDKIPLIQNK